MQSKEELEQWYANADPWAYKQTADDAIRRNFILDILPFRYSRALDIGCGEGFVTSELPAIEIHGIEISDTAAARFPWNVQRVSAPVGFYDLVMTTGTLYTQYDHAQIAKWVTTAACRHILIGGIKDWLQPYEFGRLIREREFQYREYTQRLMLYEVGS